MNATTPVTRPTVGPVSPSGPRNTATVPAASSNQRLDISGEDFQRPIAIRRMIIALFVLGPSIFLLYGAISRFDEAVIRVISACIGVCGLVWALILPAETYQYVDFTRGKILKKKWYGLFQISREEIPLSHFRTVVVRHICHPGGDSEDTFTASVGLKPAEGPIRWVKTFPATRDELPVQADKLAREVSALTSLPYLGYPPAQPSAPSNQNTQAL